MRPNLERLRPLLWLGFALAAAYGVLVHGWWTAPMLSLGDAIDAAREEERALRSEAAQIPAIEARLADVRAAEAANPGFLAEPNKDLAASALVQRLEAEVRRISPNPLACELVARTPIEAQGRDPYPRVTVQIRLRCDPAVLGALLHGLESGRPQLFIDNLALNSMSGLYGAAPGTADGRVDAVFDLYGFLRTLPPSRGVAGDA